MFHPQEKSTLKPITVTQHISFSVGRNQSLSRSRSDQGFRIKMRAEEMSHPQEFFNSGPLAQVFVSESRNRKLSENAFPRKWCVTVVTGKKLEGLWVNVSRNHGNQG